MGKSWLGYGDLLGRMAIIGYFAFTAYHVLISIVASVMQWHGGSADVSITNLMTSCATLAFLVLVVATTAIRLKPIDAAEGLVPRITALGGTFLTIFIIGGFTPTHSTPLLQGAGFVLALSGLLLSVYVLTWLGRSFSIMAEARRLVVGGPYAVVRHPLYVVEEITFVGVVLMNFSVPAALFACVQWGLQMQRMKHEENVLTRAFPEYVEYARKTPRIIPAFLWPRQPMQQASEKQS
jgi:protein-S-isoprenylcysteine O-methyltransferase Ste14